MQLRIKDPTTAKFELDSITNLAADQKVALAQGDKFTISGYSMVKQHLEIDTYLYQGHCELERDGDDVLIRVLKDTFAKFTTQQSAALDATAKVPCNAQTVLRVPRVWQDDKHFRFPVYLWGGHCEVEKMVYRDKADTIPLIINECLRQGIVDNNQIAYVLATVQWETNHTYLPVREAYWLDDRHGFENAERIRATNRTIRRYFPYYGRGFVQLTWRANYAKYARLLDIDLVGDPDLALDAETAAFILAHGMRTGTYTTRKLSDYINSRRVDFRGARRIVNGLDKASKIARLAVAWRKQLPTWL